MRMAALALALAIAVSIALPGSDKPAKKHPPAMSTSGVTTPGVQIPFANLKSEIEIPVDGQVTAIAIGDSVWIANGPKDTILVLDRKTSKAGTPIAGLHRPCSALVVAFKSLWSPNCGDQTLARIDPATAKMIAGIGTGTNGMSHSVAAGDDSIWMIADGKTTLLRVDPDQNIPVAEVRLPASCNSVAFGESAVWVTCPSDDKVLRVDPRTNLIANRIDMVGRPRSVTVGDGAVWVLCDTDGKVARIDPKTNKIAATVELNIHNGGGNIVIGEGSLWVTSAGFPISRLRTESGKEKVVQQFRGEGGGLIAVGGGSVWLATPGKGVARYDPKRVAATLAE